MSILTATGSPPIRQECRESALGLGLLTMYLTIFTVGSQIQGPPLQAPGTVSEAVLMVLTYRETSICLLAIVAACLGTWRRFNQANEGMAVATSQPWSIAYTSACIGGLITTAVVVGFPSLLDQLSDEITISRDHAGAGPRNYVSMAMIASAVAFCSGYDKTFLDRLLAVVARKVGLAAAPTPAVESGRKASSTTRARKVPPAERGDTVALVRARKRPKATSAA